MTASQAALLQRTPMTASISERLALEIELLESMYPHSVRLDRKAADLSFSANPDSTDKLVLRLPPSYPERGAPEVVLARSCAGLDLRVQVQTLVKEVCDENAPAGEEPGEVLDAVIARYLELVEPEDRETGEEAVANSSSASGGSKTTIIWLHHLLATSKRKLAINPSSSHGKVTGVTKPGYPGVMVFSGVRTAVEDHVAELKGLNWQAFAVRYEADEEWKFEGDIKEVETMAEVVQCIEEGRREAFLKAVGVK